MDIEFISYKSSPWNLCSGILTVKINNVITTFGYEGQYERFWHSGGCATFDSEWNEIVKQAPWKFYDSYFPKELMPYYKDLCNLFEANVPHGCCGGCI